MSTEDTPLFIVEEEIGHDPETGLHVVVRTDEAGSHLVAEPDSPQPEPLRFIIDDAVDDPPRAS